MSHYGHKTFNGLFSAFKQLLNAGSHRFGGSHAQVAYKVSDRSPVTVTLHESGVNVVDVEEDTVSVVLMGLNATTPAVFSDVEFVSVAGSYQVPAGKHAVLLEGSVTLGEALLNADEDLFKLDAEASVTGTAMLLVFGHNQE
jgi:NurA-like 5'-3' nuclease